MALPCRRKDKARAKYELQHLTRVLYTSNTARHGHAGPASPCLTADLRGGRQI